MKGVCIMDVLERIGKIGLVPVVVLEKASDGPPVAAALCDGGIPIMEITMRTDAGIDAIKAVKASNPEVLVGAGTVLTLDKCKESVDAGAEFIVSPGFNPKIVDWCVKNDVPITPGCVTPTEIEMALDKGLRVLKYFPAGVYGGIKGCTALQGPYKSMGLKFIPTGGISLKNLDEYSDKEFIHAIGGGWLSNPKDIASGNFDAIRETAKLSIAQLLGFEFAHVGINTADDDDSKKVAEEFDAVFGFGVKYGNSSNFAGSGIEVMKGAGLGKNGHLAVKTNNVGRAIHYLEGQGFTVDMESAKYKGDTMVAVYLKEEIGGFAIHLLQK